MNLPERPSGIVARIFASWRHPRVVIRELTGLSEGSLLVILMLALFLFFVAQWPVHTRAAEFDPSIPLDARIGGAAMAVIFVMPLIAYAAAGMSQLIVRGTGRHISGICARLALFWAALAASPAILLGGLAQGLLGPTTPTMVLQGIAGLAFMVIWIAGLVELSEPS